MTTAEMWAFTILVVFAAAVYFLPTIIAVLRQVEGITLVILFNVIPIAWPAAFIAAVSLPRRESPSPYPAPAPYASPPGKTLGGGLAVTDLRGRSQTRREL